MRFRSLLRRILKTHYQGRVSAFARALHVGPSHLSRAMGQSHTQPFDIRGCLRLAKITGTGPSEVLIAAGKREIAALIEELYGPPRELLAPEQQALLHAWNAIRDPQQREALLVIIRGAGRVGQAGPGGAHGNGEPQTTPFVTEPSQKMVPFGARPRTAAR